MTDAVSDQLENTVEYLAANETDISRKTTPVLYANVALYLEGRVNWQLFAAKDIKSVLW